MGRQAYPIIGGIIGAVVVGIYTGGAGTLQGYAAGFSLGAAVGGIAGSYIDPILIQGNKVADNPMQVAAEGGARALIYGRACVTATCIVARGNRVVTKKKSSNGKGSSGSTVNESVSWTFAIGLCESIVASSICRIWQDEKLVYDVLEDGKVSNADNAKFAEKFRFYDGNETQLPDADLQVFLGADTPYFRGTAYVVFPNFDLTQTAERIPQFKFEILNGVAGIVNDLETLGWSIPNDTVHTPSQSVTLTGSSTTTLNIDFFLTSNMEGRMYSDPSVIAVGGGGRFITADSSVAADVDADLWSGFNIYKVTVSNPAQTYYVNNALPGEHTGVQVLADGSSTFKLSVQAAGNATITFSANDVNGTSHYYPQSGSVRTEVNGQSAGPTTVALSEVISDFMLKAGLTEDQFDTSVLDDQIAGVCIQSSVTGVDAINACVAPFFADPCEKDGLLSFVKRGGDVVRTLTAEDLTEAPDVNSRENAIEYPAKLSFFYQSPATGYEDGTKATSSRYSPQANSSGEGSVTAPITFYGGDEPAQIAAKFHKVMWTEAAGSFSWTVGTECIDLVPTDVVGLFLRGVVTRARIVAQEYDGNTVKLSLIKDRQSSYTSAVTTIPLPTPTAPQPTTMSKAVLAVLDIPALSDSDDQLCYYTAVSGSTSVWQGAQVQRSLDGGSTWLAIGEVTTDVTMGRLTVAMTAADREYTDTTNTVTVQLFDANNDLVAYSDTTFLQEQGGIAVQLDDGTWEVLQYRDVVDGGSGLWTLSYLQRGRLNTSAAAHSVGALFVLLADGVVKNPAQTAWLGGVVKHRAVSYGESAEVADVVTVTYAGLSQLEWSPASAAAEYDGTWLYIHDIIGRDRFGTEVAPIASVNFQGFVVTMTDGTTTVTSNVTGDSAHIAMTPLSTISSVTVAGLNKLTGAGETLSLTPTSVAAGSLTPEAIVNAGGDA